MGVTTPHAEWLGVAIGSDSRQIYFSNIPFSQKGGLFRYRRVVRNALKAEVDIKLEYIQAIHTI